MQKAWLLLPLLLCATSPARADGWPEQAAVAGAPVPVQTRLKQQLRAHGTQITQLQQAVSEQESHSRQAGERLAEQDLEIARLQRQLEAFRDRRPAVSPGH
jgi:septal ring factor EnvC (AmiA/AmiB activator)